MRIGSRHGLDQPMQAAAHRHRVEHRFQHRSARPELIVDGQARHARGLRNSLERKILDTLRRAENRRGGGNDPLFRLRRSGIAARTVVAAWAHVIVLA